MAIAKIVLDGVFPSAGFHALMAFDAFAILLIGIWMYRKFDTEFLYYV